jgi:hypothetical protein
VGEYGIQEDGSNTAWLSAAGYAPPNWSPESSKDHKDFVRVTLTRLDDRAVGTLAGSVSTVTGGGKSQVSG